MENKNLEKDLPAGRQELARELKEEVKIAKETSWLLPASILAASILISGSVIYSTGVKNYNPSQQQANVKEVKMEAPKILENDVVLGNPDAKVTIIEFGDFQCPFCAKFYKETESLIRKNYVDTGKAKLVFKPVAILGQESIDAASAALCAKDQNKFWEFHGALFDVEYDELEKYLNDKIETSENNGNLNKALFKKIAGDLKMNVSNFTSCFDSKKYQKELAGNLQQAKESMEELSTPSIFVNGELVKGAQPYSVFSGLIDGFLK